MNPLFSWIRRHQMVTFTFLTYLLSWWTAPFIGGSILPWGLALSAWIVLAITEGRPGIRNWKQRISNWRVPGYWYLVGPSIIAFYQSSAFALNILLGATLTQYPHFPDLKTFLTLLLVGGQWEEIGWSGFALPTLQKRFANRPHGALLAALSVGGIRAIWHLPLVLSGHIPWFDMVFLSLAFQLIIAWLFNLTGSVPVVMVFHFISNQFGSSFSRLFTGEQWTNFYVLFVMLALLIAVLILWRSGFKLGHNAGQDKPGIVDRKTVQL
jgi:uncharacterized protein